MLRLTGIFRPLLVFVVAFGMFLSAFTAGNASTTVREIEGNYITTTSTSTGSVTTVVIDGQTTKVIED